MTDHLKKVRTGSPLNIPARTFNTFIDTARDFQTRQQTLGQNAQPSVRSSGTILIKNASGTDQDRFAILGIDGPVITPTDNEDEFKNKIALRGITPTADHTGKFAILLEPLASGAIGRAAISGVCPVKINITDIAHTHAEASAGQSGYLTSTATGPAQLLWSDGGTGINWAVVRIGPVGLPAGVEGDIVYHDGDRWVILNRGDNGEILTLDGGLPIWDDPGSQLPDGDSGDVLYHNGFNWVVLHKGADDEVLSLAAGIPDWKGNVLYDGYARGDILYWTGTVWNKLGIGANDQRLKVNVDIPGWVDKELPNGSSGDILYHNGTAWTKLGIGDYGKWLRVSATAKPEWAILPSDLPSGGNPWDVLTLDATSSLIWSPGLPQGTTGDILYHDGTNWVKLAKGDCGDSLTMGVSVPYWSGGILPDNPDDGDIMYFDSAAFSWVSLSPGTSGQYLKTNGTGIAPSWDWVRAH